MAQPAAPMSSYQEYNAQAERIRNGEAVVTIEVQHANHEHYIDEYGEYCPQTDLWIYGPYQEGES